MARPFLLRPVRMVLHITPERFPIQTPRTLRARLSIGQAIGSRCPVIDAPPRDLKTPGRFRLASATLYKRYHALAYVRAASHALSIAFSIKCLNNYGLSYNKLEYDTKTLPYFTLWKNTDTEKEGYVTGLEPGTGYAYTRAIEREGGRVPKLPAGESRSFRLTYTILPTKEAVSAVGREISDLQGRQTTQIDTQPTAKEAE